LKAFLYILALTVISGCSSDAERRDVLQKSGYVNEVFPTKRPTVFIKHLPRLSTASKRTIRNTTVIIADEASKILAGLLNDCTNCINSNTLIKPLRVHYVPTGSKFKVISEYLYFKRNFPFADITGHFLLLKDENNEISEISKLAFEMFFFPEYDTYSRNPNIINRIKDIETLKNRNQLSINYCPYLDINKNQDISQFFTDFSLDNEVVITKALDICEQGYNLKFSDSVSYLTARYFFNSWRLYGQWQRS